MLQKLGDHIHESHKHAAEGAELAKTEPDGKVREKLLKMEQTWTHPAKSYELVQSLESFLLDAHRRVVEGIDAPRPQRRAPPADGSAQP